MVGTQEDLVPVGELVLSKGSSQEDTDVNKELESLKMESTSAGTDATTLTTRLRGGQSNEDIHKKLVSSQDLSIPSRDHSHGSEQQEENHGVETLRHQARRALNRFVGISGPASMETDIQDGKTSAEAFQDIDMDSTAEAENKAYPSGKEVPRCDSQNLDSSPDYGRLENFQGNSRHSCKFCAKDFASGRALGGHMRAHGSLNIEEGSAWTTSEDGKEKQQLSGSIGHTSHCFTDSGSDHVLSNSLKQESSPPYSKRSNNVREIESLRSGGRRSKNDVKQVDFIKSSEEIVFIKHEEENPAAPIREQEPNSSSDEDGNNEGGNEDGVTDDAANNVCNVCDREFENGKQLNFHKKSHGLYALRRNPKRSRRFIDQDYTAEATAAAAVPAKKASSMFTPDGNMHACTECGKRFQSWKALFGHMRCHPERNWRGIHRPDVAKDKQDGTSSAERQVMGSRRKEKTLHNAPSQESDSESEAGCGIERTKSSKAEAAVSDNESDTESIEAAYMNGERQPSTSTGWIWMTGKRSKRSRQTVRSLQVVTKTATTPPTPAENEMEHETAMGLMMLARKEGGKENWLERRSPELEVAVKDFQGNASSETEGDELENLDNENVVDSDGEDIAPNNKGKAKLEAVDNASHCEDNEEGGDDCEGAEQATDSTKPKYVCNTCKRVFKSHQALGGHRASHKKVKGCFARTNVNDGGQDNADEEMMSEEFVRSEGPLPTELQQDPSQSAGDEKERQFSTFSKEDSGEMVNGNRTKTKGHVCTICGRVFNSGQALGGHKRCHYNTKEGTSSEATSSTTNTNKHPTAGVLHQGHGGQSKICKDELIQQRGPARMEEARQMQQGKSGSEDFIQPAQVRQVKEKFLDLNLPAPWNDDDMDLEAYDMPPADLMCASLPRKLELNGAVEFSSAAGTAKSDEDLEKGKQKEEFFPLYHSGKCVSRAEENHPDLGGGQDTGFRSGEVDFSLRYVRCNICNRQFNTVEALSNHEKTHASMMSSVSGLTPISA